jgi:hypothetical protein
MWGDRLNTRSIAQQFLSYTYLAFTLIFFSDVYLSYRGAMLPITQLWQIERFCGGLGFDSCGITTSTASLRFLNRKLYPQSFYNDHTERIKV